MSVSDSTRDRAWLQLHDIMRLSRYYATIGSIHSKWQSAIHAINLASSIGAIAALLEQWTPGMIVAGALVGITSVVSATWNNPSRVSAILSASTKCRIIEIEAGRVWTLLENMTDDQAIKAWVSLAEKLEQATSPVEMVGVGFSDRQNERASKMASQDMKLSVPASVPHKATSAA